MLSYLERQNRWLKENNTQAGDKVVVKFIVPSNCMGWDNSWVTTMSDLVNEALEIDTIESSSSGVGLRHSGYIFRFPYFCLEKVEVRDKQTSELESKICQLEAIMKEAITELSSVKTELEKCKNTK